jgi:hypothetical protein
MTPLPLSPGTVAVPTTDIGRFTQFTVSLACTAMPPESFLSVRSSVSVVENLNGVIRDLRDIDRWVWIQGDDHVWRGNELIKMLEIMEEHELDILVPLVCKRNPPWDLVIYHDAGERDGYPAFRTWTYDELPDDGLPFEVYAAGSAGMLVRREVLDALGEPWFVSSDGRVLNEDVLFCLRVKEKGYKVWATTEVQIGHIGIYRVFPAVKDDRWGSMVDFTSAGENYQQVWFPGGPRAFA